MNPLNPAFLFAPLLVAMLVAFGATRFIGPPPEEARYASIDGLRGYMATFVFLHHSALWYFYVRSGKWDLPESNLHSHLGTSAVAIFFMITGFLFFSKLLAGMAKPIDWAKLFISRALRLTPLYLFVLALMLLVTAALSHFTLRESPLSLLKGLFYWATFNILGAPNLNGIPDTRRIVAGVFWTLPYEWLFYFSLPLMAWCLRRAVPTIFIALSAIAVLSAIFKGPPLAAFSPFLGGVAASILVRSPLIQKFAASWIAAVVALMFLVVTVIFYPTPEDIVPTTLLFLVFAIIACGNTFFGLLTHPASKTLGQISYSIYLLHGLLLFVTFKFIIGFERAATFSPVEHWLVISVCAALLILISSITFRFIEAPAMRSVPAVTAWLRGRSIRRQASVVG